MMLDQLVAELREESAQHRYQIDWFDRWDVEQRIWLLEHAAYALLTDEVLEPAAMWEATAEALYAEIADLIEIEIMDAIKRQSLAVETETGGETSWRTQTRAAFCQQNPESADVPEPSMDIQAWRSLVARLADELLGVRLYVQAEPYRDKAYSETRKFLQRKGLPEDFLERIPPVLRLHETQMAIDRLQILIFKD